MISIVRFIETANQRAKIGTTGFDSEDETNRKIAEIQTALMNVLSPLYETNQQVAELLSPFVSYGQSTLTDGYLVKETDHVRIISLSVGGYPVFPTRVNSIAMLKQNSIRRPSSADNRYYYAIKDDGIQIYPEEAMIVDFDYISRPSEAKITKTPVSANDNVYETLTADGDLEWPEEAFNLLLYMFLDRLGVEMKEQLLIEYGNLGISKEAISTDPKP